jgi:hypothetical protein
MEKLMYFYVLTTPLGNGVGCFKAGIAGMVEESRINGETFRQTFDGCLAKGLFEYDEHNRVLLIPKYFERNPPANQNGVKAVSKHYVRIPWSPLKLKCYHIVREWCEKKGGTFPQTFLETFEEPPGSISPSPPYSPSPPDPPTGSTLPNGNGFTAPQEDAASQQEITDLDTHKKSKAAEIYKKQLKAAGHTKPKTNGSLTWEAYAEAYLHRYGVEPKRNKKMNSLCKTLCERLGAEEAPKVAQYYLSSRNGYYVSRGHALECLVKDAEKVRTEWATGRPLPPQPGQRLTAQEQAYLRNKEVIRQIREDGDA